jgi:hypothetical protein
MKSVFILLLTSWATKPLRQLYPDPNAESTASNAARIEYVGICSHLALLIKQALINAHINPKYKPVKDATTGLAFFATPHRGEDRMLVSIGGVVAKIATTVGFQKGDDVLETLKNGSIFSDIMQEHWRHQLLKYDIISFWGALDKVSRGS